MRRPAWGAPILLAALCAAAGCAGPSAGARAPDAGAPGAGTPAVIPLFQAGDSPDGLPGEAFEQLAKSLADSCSVCARDARRKAFRSVAERFPAGVVVWSDSGSAFERVAGSANALKRSGGSPGAPQLTYRFHTAADRLVGIADADLTDDVLAARFVAAPENARLQAAVRIIPFEYGDGPTFLYHAAGNAIELQCRLLEISEE